MCDTRPTLYSDCHVIDFVAAPPFFGNYYFDVVAVVTGFDAIWLVALALDAAVFFDALAAW
jgi:hypothetical protein